MEFTEQELADLVAAIKEEYPEGFTSREYCTARGWDYDISYRAAKARTELRKLCSKGKIEAVHVTREDIHGREYPALGFRILGPF